jgi:hypothetical protein
MAGLCNALTAKVVQLLTSATGIDAVVTSLAEEAGISPAASGTKEIVIQNIPFDLAERGMHAKYPAIYVYCDKVSNILREKFRNFSGTAHVTVEIRYSQDRLEDVDRGLQLYVDAACQVLDAARGDWGGGAFYTGGYEAVFGPLRKGGRNFLQTAKIGFEVEVSR